MVTDRTKLLLLSNRKHYMLFRLFISVLGPVKVQGWAHFDCCKLYHCHQIWSNMYAFNGHIYNWACPILKIKDFWIYNYYICDYLQSNGVINTDIPGRFFSTRKCHLLLQSCPCHSFRYFSYRTNIHIIRNILRKKIKKSFCHRDNYNELK